MNDRVRGAGRLLRDPSSPDITRLPSDTHVAPSKGPLSAGARVNQYEILDQIGAGGMGVVYKAYDTRLKRTVALKALSDPGTDPSYAQRLQREAVALARLRHEGIVALYEAGDVSGMPYLAMEFVEGKELHAILQSRSLSLRESVRLIERVARALHYAHQQGVIHRDLKPSNILIDGEGRPHILDFGLARLESERIPMTRSGDVIGTPAYMAPEQIQGHQRRIGPATDIYSLGATLFEMATGRLPHVAESISELIYKVVNEKPTWPRSRIPADLRRVLLRTLEKDPARRYPSAGEFADDLGRWIRGEPVRARATPAVPRAFQAAGAALVLIVVGLTITAAVRTRRLEETRHRYAAELSLRAQTHLEAALHARRAGDLAAMDRQASLLREACRRTVAERANLPEPHYYEGRMDRARMEFDSALVHQDRALSKNASFAPSLYERIVLLTRQYRLRLQEIALEASLSQSGESVRFPAVEEVHQRDDKLRDLRQRIQRDLESLPETAPERRIAEGLWWTYGGRAEQARERLEANPRLEESLEALAETAMAQGKFDSAVDWCTRGHESDRGYVPYLLLRALARFRQGFLAGEDSTARWTAALEDCERALALRSRSSGARLLRAQILTHVGDREARAGGNPESRYLQAISECPAPLWKMFARFKWGLHRQGRGEDPTDLYERGAQDGESAIQLSPGSAMPYLVRSYVHLNWGMFEQGRELDAEALLRKAIADAEEALRRIPASTDAVLCRAQARASLAHTRPSPERDELYDQALQDCAELLKRTPAIPNVYLVRGRARIRWASQRSEKTRELYEFGLEDCREFLKHQPRSAEVHLWRANAFCNLGVEDLREGRDPAPKFREAIEACAAAEALAYPSWELSLVRAWTELHWGIHAEKNRQDPTERYQRALTACDAGLGRCSGSSKLRTARALVRMSLAIHRANDAVFAQTLLEGATRDWDAVLGANPRSPDALWRRGHCRWLRGDSAGADADFRRAAELSPASVPEFRELWERAKKGR